MSYFILQGSRLSFNSPASGWLVTITGLISLATAKFLLARLVMHSFNNLLGVRGGGGGGGSSDIVFLCVLIV